ncbi:MAG: hypothetical protein WCE64_09495 [Bacteroidales bacterium]
MKKLTTCGGAILVLVMLIFSSCKKDKPLSELMVGKWAVESVTEVDYENNVKVSSFTIYAQPNDMAIQFASEGTGDIFQSDTLAGSFTWTLSGSTLSISGGSTVLNWTITIEGDILTWSFAESQVLNNITYKYEYFYSAKKQ